MPTTLRHNWARLIRAARRSPDARWRTTVMLARDPPGPRPSAASCKRVTEVVQTSVCSHFGRFNEQLQRP